MEVPGNAAFRPVRGLRGRSDKPPSRTTALPALPTAQHCTRTHSTTDRLGWPHAVTGHRQDTCRFSQRPCAHSAPPGRIAHASHDAAARCHAEAAQVSRRPGGVHETAQAARLSSVLSCLAALPEVQPQPVQALRIHHHQLHLAPRLGHRHAHGQCCLWLRLLARLAARGRGDAHQLTPRRV